MMGRGGAGVVLWGSLRDRGHGVASVWGLVGGA